MGTLPGPALTIVRDPSDIVAHAPSVTWAIGQLVAAFEARGGRARRMERADLSTDDAPSLVVATNGSARTAELFAAAGVPAPDAPEAVALVPSQVNGGPALLAWGSDARGLTYAVLEMADRVEHAVDPLEALRVTAPIVEAPANTVRSVARLFCSEVEDKQWFHDEGFWVRYLSMLATQRFNRFSLTLGLGYNYHQGVSDAYLYFAYPFLVSVTGHDVRVPQLLDEERGRNLAMLRFAAEQAAVRGLDFQLGLWTHAFAWIDSPDAHHTVEGLTPDSHAAYCRDALRMILEECPAISGATFRIHGEGGIPEGSWDFWRTVLEGVADCGRPVGIDLHAKGLDERTLRHALDTGQRVTVSPKFWAEHMGLPYHQAAIRESERVPRDDLSHISEWHRHMTVSEGSRPFTRYGYGDFLREDRPYDLVFRLWPGTQRLLLWGDPAFAAAYERAASLAGAQGLEWCEPLAFKGREGSGAAGSRTGYADRSLEPADDWAKFAYTYRLFGRLTYNPGTDAETWRRPLRAHFGEATLDAEAALASASRILPLVTVAHHPSASNNYYWPELYTDMPIVWSAGATVEHPYEDTPEPRRFGTVDPLDPEVFTSVADFIAELRSKQPSGRVSPLEVAAWLDGFAADARHHLAQVRCLGRAQDSEVRRWLTDIGILAELGSFYAGKTRAAVQYELHHQTSNWAGLERAVEAYRTAREAWSRAADQADGVYVTDLTFGPQQRIRGHWADRLPAIDADLRCMADLLEASEDREHAEGHVDLGPRARPDIDVTHNPPGSYNVGEDLPLDLEVSGKDAATVRRIAVRFRAMNQALAFETRDMDRFADVYRTTVPAACLDGRYPLAYAFVLHAGDGLAWRCPDLGADLTNQPYYVVRPL